ncbi:MAG TPA: hypothetical protein VIP05_06685, partial [Burkholderiaceae bacterium]
MARSSPSKAPARTAARPARRAPRARTAAAPSDKAVEADIASATGRAPAGSHAHGPEAFGAAIGGFLNSLGGLQVPQAALSELQDQYVNQATALWNNAVDRMPVFGKTDAPAAPAAIGDRRFAAEDWLKNPAAAFTAQLYLLNARTLTKLADSLQGDEKTKARVRFAVQQFVDAASPANYL